jgi:hypothetical protein
MAMAFQVRTHFDKIENQHVSTNYYIWTSYKLFGSGGLFLDIFCCFFNQTILNFKIKNWEK